MLLRTVVFFGVLVQATPTPTVILPSQPLRFGAFTARFDPSGTFNVDGQGWPKLEGTWTIQGAEIELRTPSAPKECAEPARYRVTAVDGHPTFAVIADPCQTPRNLCPDPLERPDLGSRLGAQRFVMPLALSLAVLCRFMPGSRDLRLKPGGGL